MQIASDRCAPGQTARVPIAWAAIFFVASCSGTIAATQIMAVIDAEPGVRAMTKSVHVLVRGGTGAEDTWTIRHDAVVTMGTIAWPLEVALIPKSDDSERVYEVVATAINSSGDSIARVRAISGYVKGETRALRLLFEDSCLGKADLCGAEETCSGGGCVDAHVDPASLEQFRPGGSTGVTPKDAGADAAGKGAASNRNDGGPTLGMDSAVTRGDGGMPPTDAATEVDAGPPLCVKQVAPGACVLKGDRTVWCWGSNTSGEVGNGTLDSPIPDPYRVASLGNNVVSIGRGYDDNYSYLVVTCALKGDGTLWCWGNNSTGGVGDGTTDGEACTSCNPTAKCKTVGSQNLSPLRRRVSQNLSPLG